MGQALLFVVGLAALLAVVPLSIWAATGRWRSAMWAAREYGMLIGALAGFMLLGSLVGGIAALFTP